MKLIQDNKKFFTVGFVVLSAVIGIILSYLMYRFVGEVAPEYFEGVGVYGMPYNIGFRGSALCGVAALVAFHVALYAATGCDRNYYIETLISGIWIANALIIPEVSSRSRMFFFLRVRDDLGFDMGYGFFRIWNSVEYVIYLVVVVIVVSYLYILLFENGEYEENEESEEKEENEDNEEIIDEKAENIIHALMMFMTAIGCALLVLRCYTNIWYLLLCCTAFVLAGIVLKKMEKYWDKYLMD